MAFFNKKKFFKLFGFSFLGIILFPIIIFIILQFSFVQTLIGKKLCKYFSEELNTKIQIEKLDISIFDGINIENFIFKTQKKDTLIFFEKLNIDFEKNFFQKNAVFLKKIFLKNANCNLNLNKNHDFNFKFISDYFNNENSEEDTTKEDFSFKLFCKNIELENINFSYKTFSYINTPKNINYNDISVKNLNLKINDFFNHSDTLKCEIENLNFKEKSGFFMRDFFAKVLIHSKIISLNDLKFNFNSSFLNAHFYEMSFEKFENFTDFNEKIFLNSHLKTSKIFTQDIAFFAEALNSWNQEFILFGKLEGTVSDLKSKDLKIHFGVFSQINLNFEIKNLLEIEKTVFDVEIKNLFSNKKDLEKVQIYPFSDKKFIELSKEFDNLKKFNLKLNFKGKISDFVSYGNLKTNIANLIFDFKFKDENNIKIQGNIKSNIPNFDDFFEKNAKIGIEKLNCDFKINGEISKENNFNFLINGEIENLFFQKNNYKNIKVKNAKISNEKYLGWIDFSKANENLKGQIFAEIDISKKTPKILLKTKIINFKPFHFGLQNDSLFEISFDLLDAKFQGNQMDNLIGNLSLNDLYLQNKLSNLKLNKLKINSVKTDSIKNIEFNSDFFDAKLKGKFNFQDILENSEKLFFTYFPTFFKNDILKISKFHSLKNEFDMSLSVNLKNVKPIISLFFENFEISKNTKFSLNFSRKNEKNNFKLNFNSDSISHNDLKIKELVLNLENKNDEIFLQKEAKKIFLTKDFFIKNLVSDFEIKNNTINSHINWENESELSYNSNLNFSTTFEKIDSLYMPKINFSVFPSYLFLIDTIWEINYCDMSNFGNTIEVYQFLLKNDEQHLKIRGTISENKKDSLYINCKNLDLKNINHFFSDLKIDGKLHGEIKITDIYKNFCFFSDLELKKLEIENENFGNGKILSNWNNEKEKLFLNMFSKIEDNEIFKIKGDFFAKKNFLNFDTINFNNLKLKILEPYLDGILSNIDGLLNAKLNLKGDLKNLNLRGNLNFEKITFTVDYLQTRYNFSGDFKVFNEKITFDSIPMNYILTKKEESKKQKIWNVIRNTKKIEKNGLAYLSGNLSHKNFENLKFSVDLETKNFLLLNTKESDNDLFYGQAYGTGLVKIYGDTENMFIDTEIKTEKNTKLFVPLSSVIEASEYNFYSFVNPNKTKIVNENFQSFPPASAFGMDLNFDINVTPDAEVQLIFNQKSGEIMSGVGSGNIKMEINSYGNFNMYGDYTIKKGDYLLNLMNFTSKKFEVEPGGTIFWSGSPYDAAINLNAVYTLKTSPQNLMARIDTSSIYKRRMQVFCKLQMSEKLSKPKINFAIDINSKDSKLNGKIKSMPEEEVNKQILSLLVMGSFYTPNLDESESSSDDFAMYRTTSEYLSNQLSHWLSQINNDFDVGVNYRPGDEITKDEVDLALSTQILNDRVTINGNMGVGGQNVNASSNDFMGDINVNIKLTKNGKLQLKTFSRSDPTIYDDVSPYTQGIGIFYKEDFNSVKELLKKYRNKFKKIFSKK